MVYPVFEGVLPALGLDGLAHLRVKPKHATWKCDLKENRFETTWALWLLFTIDRPLHNLEVCTPSVSASLSGLGGLFNLPSTGAVENLEVDSLLYCAGRFFV